VNAALAPVDATGIGLTASLTPLAADPTAFTLAFTIDVQNVVLEERDGKWTGGLTFLPLEQNDYGKVTDSAPQGCAEGRTDVSSDGEAVGGESDPAGSRGSIEW
jgi:hypothetical protein